eukprot:PITA_03608
MIDGAPWEDYHHRSHLLNWKEDNSSNLDHPLVFDFLRNTLNTVDSERSLSNIEETTAINISTKTDVVENIHVGKFCSSSKLEIYSALFRDFRDVFAWSYDEMPAILQEFDLEFKKSKSKKALVFTELLCDLPSSSNNVTSEEAIVDENLFLISSSDPWYEDIIVYLQTQTYRSNTSLSEQRWIRYQVKDYVIVGDTLYHRGIDTVLRRYLTREEAEKVLNDCHSSACGGHQSGYATTQKKIRAGYFWPTMFKDCITVVRSCHACQIFDSKTRRPPAPLQPVVVVGPFAKWGIYFMTCNPTSAGGHGYIIVTIDYFTKWVEAMPTLNNSGETTALFFFNHVDSRFGIPQAIVTDHGSYFYNHMMVELAAKLGLSHDSSTPYYLQANGQVEAINKVLKRMLQRMIGVHKRSWHLILYLALWAYQKLVRNATGFTPFQLVYGLEVILPVQCEILSLKLAVDLLPRTSEEEAHFLELIQLDETHRNAASTNEAHKE